MGLAASLEVVWDSSLSDGKRAQDENGKGGQSLNNNHERCAWDVRLKGKWK